MTWIAPTPETVDGPTTGPDRPILSTFLAWERSTLLAICAGLTGAQLASRPIPSTTLSLLGLIRHAAKVERIWFRQGAAGESVEPLYDLALGKDADFERTDPDAAAADLDRLRAEWVQVDAAVADLGLDHEFTFKGEVFSLRMAYLHVIAEYSRHNGHADLLREAIDGVTGR